MPELPDIEVYRHAVNDRVAGHRVTNAWVRAVKRTPPEADLRARLLGATLTGIERDGKALRFVFDNGNVLVVHLMLNGEFHMRPTAEEISGGRVVLEFEGAGCLAITDFTGLTTITLNQPASTVADALDPAFDLEALRRALARRSSKSIKETLIEQSVVQGIGNKYSDEILYAAAIAPQSRANRIPDEAVVRLHAAIKSVLTEANARLLSLYPAKMNGKMRDGLKVHRQEKTPTGHPVVTGEFSGRTMYYSPDEQTLYE